MVTAISARWCASLNLYPCAAHMSFLARPVGNQLGLHVPVPKDQLPAAGGPGFSRTIERAAVSVRSTSPGHDTRSIQVYTNDECDGGPHAQVSSLVEGERIPIAALIFKAWRTIDLAADWRRGSMEVSTRQGPLQ
jgi:hypothetical protein